MEGEVDKVLTIALHRHDKPSTMCHLRFGTVHPLRHRELDYARGDIGLALHTGVRHLAEAAFCDEDTSSTARRWLVATGQMNECVPPPSSAFRIAQGALRGEKLTRLAVLLTFCDPFSAPSLQLLALSNREWRNILQWLDISGLSLHFFNRLIEIDLCHLLPAAVFARLQQNLTDNTQRTRAMIAESIAIQTEFQREGFSYANLKGLSLCPSSVPKPELRLQFDLDFLVAEKHMPEARRILERRGYRLNSMNGRSWEFKFNDLPWLDLKDLYKDFRSYVVDLHGEPAVPDRPSPLERLEWRELHGFGMPTLSPVDLLLGQGLHAFKHIYGGYSRAAHLLEFRRHVLSHRNESAFWHELQEAATEHNRASLELGVVTLLITRVMGNFAPEAFTMWTVDRLPRPVRLWVEMYGHRVALGAYPGDKLHLLLQKELELAGIAQKHRRPLRQALLPLRLPSPVIRVLPNEPLAFRIRRYSMYPQLIFERLRFHILEGFRFALEWRRLRRMKESAQ
jgi:hypothetical protein